MEFDDSNIIALCWRCHNEWWHRHPLEVAKWITEVLSAERLDRLLLRSQTSGVGSRDYNLLKIYLSKQLEQLRKK
jgi:hypothetical protein